MGGNRKRPFGYRMEFGEVVLHPAEAETVRWIYDSYLAGASYNALVDKLRERGISYDGDKPWNKNMAARILADRRYTGEGGFPSIIPEGQFHMVQVRRQERTMPCQKSPAQKELRKLCGGSPPAWVERQVLGLLNRLIQCFLSYSICYIRVHTLCGTASQGQCLNLGNIASDNCQFQLLHQLNCCVCSKCRGAGTHRIQKDWMIQFIRFPSCTEHTFNTALC